jgi:rod shape-determining protein MreD
MMNPVITKKPFKITAKTILNIAFFFVSILLQYSFVTRISVFGVMPNLPIAIAIVTGIVSDSVFGGAAGFAAGLYHDAMTGKILGMYALFGLYAGVLAGFFSKKHRNENLLTVILITYLLSVFYEGCVFLFGYTIPLVRSGAEASADVIYAFTRIILPEAALNTIYGLVAFLALKAKRVKDDADDIMAEINY